MIVHPVSTSHNHDGVYAPIGSTGGVTVQDEGAPLTARGTINFTGDGVSAADDAVNERTNVTISGGGVTDHGALTGLSDDDHTQYVKHSLATAASDFLVASGVGAFVKKTLAEVKAILGLGSAAYTESTDYLGATAKAADSDKLDNHDTSYFATADHNHAGVYPGIDGWIPVSSTWTYASATTITVPSGAAAIYKVGQGFRLTANGVVKQGYIVGAADTLLTTAGDALTNHTFSAISYTNTPGTAIGFPVWFNYTPTVTSASGAFGTGGVTSSNSKFAINGRILHYKYMLTVTDVGTAGVFVIATLAVNPPTGFRDTGAGLAYLTSSGAYRSDLATVLASTSMRIYKTGGTFPAVNLETMVCSGAYEI